MAFLVSSFSLSCTVREPVEFALHGLDSTVLYGLTKESPAGITGFSARPKPLRYQFDPPLRLPPTEGWLDYSLELEYRFEPAADSSGGAEFYMTLDLGRDAGSWYLPLDAAFRGVTSAGIAAHTGGIRYSIPVSAASIGEFTLTGSIEPVAGSNASISMAGGSRAAPTFQLQSLRFVPRWYGFSGTGGSADTGSEPLRLTPFVSRDGQTLIIDPPPDYRMAKAPELVLEGLEGGAAITAGKRKFEYRVSGASESPAPGSLRLPPGILGTTPYPITITPAPLTAVILAAGPDRPFPNEPIPADPGLILSWPQSAWRDPRYEVFRWPAFPQILIFDTADYEVQNNLLRRLAFFVEKAGYRGRLVTDKELEGQHGWNAHDYRAEDLARFFEAARKINFPLLPEERELRALLLETAVLIQEPQTGAIKAGTGAIISFSRESSEYLRYRLLVHESFHGLFFIDEDFRDFSRRRWEALPAVPKRFIRSFFDYQHYDTTDPYLLVNEFMAYCLQQPASQAGEYFGQYIARQIDESSWRRAVLPPADLTPDGGKHWPTLAAALTREAEAFSTYATRRWGLAAGRVWTVYVD